MNQKNTLLCSSARCEHASLGLDPGSGSVVASAGCAAPSDSWGGLGSAPSLVPRIPRFQSIDRGRAGGGAEIHRGEALQE